LATFSNALSDKSEGTAAAAAVLIHAEFDLRTLSRLKMILQRQMHYSKSIDPSTQEAGVVSSSFPQLQQLHRIACV